MVTRVENIFEIMYGRLPTEKEISLIDIFGNIEANASSATLARHLLGMHDRNLYPTPFLVRFSSSDVRFCSIEGIELAIDASDHGVSLPVERGIYAPETVKFLRETLKPGMNFMDIGANIGYFTMIGASLVGPQGNVIAIEPYSENCRLLMLSIDRNGFNNIQLHAMALGRSEGAAFFAPGLGSNAGFMPQARDQLLNSSCIVVPVTRLDNLAPDRVDLIKIDVEGAEAMIFEGAPRLLEKTRPIIFAEFAEGMTRHTSGVEPADYLKRMQALDYVISRMDPKTAEEVPVPDVDRFMSEDWPVVGPLLDLVFRPN